jgi:hypothetical protein
LIIFKIFIDGQSIGGYDNIRLLDATGELDRLLITMYRLQKEKGEAFLLPLFQMGRLG